METRELGQVGLRVGAIGYGAMGTAMAYGPTDDTQSIAAIRRAYEMGVTLFDTAELYGWGDGEKLLGQALAPIRDEVVIATKFGMTPSMGYDSRPHHIREVIDNSLQNLGVDVIDLVYQHRVDPNVPIEDVIGTMRDLIDAGKVRYIGLSEADADIIRRAHVVHPISVVQTEYSIFARDVEAVFPVLDQLGIGFVAYSPIARGFLSGRIQPRDVLASDDVRQIIPWWAPENFEANLAIVRKLTDLADAKGISLAQLAIAWILAQNHTIVPIPGSRDVQRVAENIAAADVTLTASDLEQIAAAAPGGGVGERLRF